MNRDPERTVSDPVRVRAQRRRVNARIRARRVGGRGPKVPVGMFSPEEPASRRGEVVSDLRRLDRDERGQQDRRDERDRPSYGRAHPLRLARAGLVWQRR